MSASRRLWLGAIAGMIAASAIGADEIDCRALAGQKIRWVMPYSVGGSYDTLSRLATPLLAKRLGSEFAIEYFGGAGGLLGMRALADAKPDGSTIGIIDGAAMMLGPLVGQENMPDPLKDLTILARVTRAQRVWAVAADSPIRSMDYLVTLSSMRPVVFAAGDIASSSFASAALPADLLGLRIEIVLGYKGNRASGLALARGEIDVIASNFDSLLKRIVAGEIRPILQLTSARISDEPSLDPVPLLGGEKGLAAQRAEILGRDVDQARRDAGSIEQLLGVGRLIVAPKGLVPEIEACLAGQIYGVLASDVYDAAVKKVKRSIDPAHASDARDAIIASNAQAERFTAILAEHVRRVHR